MNEIKQADIMDWYFVALKKAFTIKGRSVRAEYWSYIAASAVAYVISTTIDIIFACPLPFIDENGFTLSVTSLYLIMFFVTLTTLYIRRLHDLGLNGGWIFSPILFIAMSLILLWRNGMILMHEYGDGIVHLLQRFGVDYHYANSELSYGDIAITLLFMGLTLLNLAALFIFSLLRGEPRDNDYGLDTTRKEEPVKQDDLYSKLR